MPTAKQRRAAAQRKLQRQLARRAELARQRRLRWLIVASAAAVLVVLAAVLLYIGGKSDKDASASPSASPGSVATRTYEPTNRSPKSTSGPCKYAEDLPTLNSGYAKDVGLPKDPSPTPTTGTVVLDVSTNRGDMQFTLDRAKAPCAVQSLQYLVSKKFYDNTPCHRLVKQPQFGVLQCGDPSGTGAGGATYSYKEEKPTGADPYKKGVIAMAKGNDTASTGSQFFIMFEDTKLSPADYSVVGTVTKGLDTVLKIAAAGEVDASGAPGGPGDGTPKERVTIKKVTETN